MSEPNASAISTPRAVSRTHKLTVTAMLSTVAFLLMFIEFPIPALIPAFVKLDISDLPELLAAFSLGPIYGVIVTLLKNVLFSVLHVRRPRTSASFSTSSWAACFPSPRASSIRRKSPARTRLSALSSARC